MSYRDYDSNNLENSGNMRLLNPDGIDLLTRTVQDGTYQIVCQKCGKPLERWYNGEWVPERTQNTNVSGYLITQMNAVWVSPDRLKQQELNAKSVQTFHNYVLGEPYQDESLAMTERDVLDARREYLPEPLYDRGDYVKIAAGIDWGTHADHIVILGLKENGTSDVIRLIHIPVVISYKNVNAEIQKVILELVPYNPDIILADLGFNGNKVNQLINEFGKDKVYGVNVKPVRSKGEVAPTFSDTRNEVSIDKLTANITAMNLIKSSNVGFYQQEDDMLKLFIQHGRNVIIRDMEDSQGNLYKDITRRGGDHFFQSLTYAIAGIRRMQDIMAENEGAFGYTQVNAQAPANLNNNNFYGI